MKSEDDEDQHQGGQVREGPHQVVFLRALTDTHHISTYGLHEQANKTASHNDAV